ncbi:FtsX-like permease family protein [soil metagenome]
MRIDVIYQKIWADLWGNKVRTLQVAMIVALGAFGIGLVIGSRNLIVNVLNAEWQQSSPPAIKLSVNPPMNDETLAGFKNIEGVEAVEGLLTTLIEWRASPQDEWQSAFLSTREDYRKQKMAKYDLLTGGWPERKQFAIAKGSDTVFGLNQGQTIWVRINDRERQITIGGIINRIGSAPFFTGKAEFLATRARIAELFGNADFNTIQFSIGKFDQRRAEAVDQAIKDRLKKLGIDSRGADEPLRQRILPPNIQPASTLRDAILAIMGLVGGVIIVLGLLLVFNTVTAIITQQIDQIGVMKAIGARSGQILHGYLLLIFGYGLLATLISVPLAALAANGLKGFFLNITNATNPGFQIDPLALGVQVTVALLSPLLAALAPVLSGIRITVREAISSYGITGSAGLLDRLVTKAKGVPYSWLLIIGNTFRNKQRVILLEVTLVGSGLIFMVIMGVSDSTNYTFDEQLRSIHTYQVAVAFEEPQRIQRIEASSLAQPNAKIVEMWYTTAMTIRPATQAKATVDDEQAKILGVPPDTKMYKPQIERGRWLQPDDSNGIVLNKALATKLGIDVGDQVILRRDGDRDSIWQIVGILFDPLTNDSVHMPRATLARLLNKVNKANALWVKTAATDAQSTKSTALTLEKRFEARNIAIAPETVFSGKTIDDIVYSKLFTYNLLVQLLAILAAVIAIVGGVGLSGVLTLSVLERTREIGVMRAIGASSGQITRLFIGEGLLLGLLSWAIALPVSIPLAHALTTRILTTILNEEIIYRFTPFGPLLWLAIISVLSILASWFPARSATRVSVRTSLAYQ